MISLILDVNLVAWLVVIGWIVSGVSNIILGATHSERKSTTYGGFEILWGTLTLIFVLVVLIWA